MVCGCDGIQSAVKEFVNSGRISANKTDRKLSSIYSGVRIRFALEDSGESLDTFGSSELRQYFGDGAYGLYGTYGAGEGENIKRAAYLVYQDSDYFGPIKRKDAKSSVKEASENVDWKEARRSNIKEETITRMQAAGLPDFQLRPVVEQSDNFFELGVYFHNPFSFRGWKREVKGLKGAYCVLCGDSAHAMPPFLGQGANQAIQDAYCLANKIVEHNANCEEAVADMEAERRSLQDLLQEYESVRWFPTASITIKSIFLGYLETGGKGIPSKFRDALFFVLGKLGIAEQVFLDSATPNV
jgi:2-polyprenyl-6-methoxyphenol hydroxylase-like FAD-dependent oxidoreductase